LSSSKVTIGKFAMNEVNFPNIKIDRISPGKTVIKELTLEGLELSTEDARLTLQGITIDTKLFLFLDYKISGVVTKHGTAFAMGEIQLALNVGDIKLDIPDIVASIEETKIQNLEVSVAPIDNLIFPGIVAKVLELNNLRLPTSGFTISHGMKLESMELSNLTIPDADAKKIMIKSVSGMNVNVPGIELPGISLELEAGDIDLKNVGAKVSKKKQCTPWVPILRIPLPTLNFDARICVRPETSLTIDKLAITNIKQKLGLKKMTATNLVLPFDVLGIQLTNLKIKGIEVPQVEVAESS